VIVRSNFAITRLIVLPFGALLALYLLVVVAGGTWLYLQVRAVETRLLIGDVRAVLDPLTEKLRTIDAASAIRQPEPWLLEDVKALFADIPSLRKVDLRGPTAGIQQSVDGEKVASRATAPLPADARPQATNSSPAQRLHSESDKLFVLGFDLTRAPAPLVRLDFSFDRLTLLARVREGVDLIKRSIIGFSGFGAVSILFAVAITLICFDLSTFGTKFRNTPL